MLGKPLQLNIESFLKLKSSHSKQRSLQEIKHQNFSKIKSNIYSPKSKQTLEVPNQSIITYQKIKAHKLPKRLQHIYFLHKDIDKEDDKSSSNVEQPRVKQNSRLETLHMRNRSDFVISSYQKPAIETLQTYCEIKLQQYKDHMNIAKYENIVKGIINRGASKNKNADLFLNNQQRLYRKYKKLHNRVATQLPQLLESNRIDLKDKQSYTFEYKNKSKLRCASMNTDQQPNKLLHKNFSLKQYLKNSPLTSKNTKPRKQLKKQKIKTEPITRNFSPKEYRYFKGLNDKIKENVDEEMDDMLIDEKLSPWEIELKATHIELPNISKYRKKK